MKNKTLRFRTDQLTEVANTWEDYYKIGYELEEIGKLIRHMAFHIGDLQSKIDSQAEGVGIMTKREIFESYDIKMVWKPEHNVELSEEEIQETHKFAKLVRKAFDEYYGDNVELEGDKE